MNIKHYTGGKEADRARGEWTYDLYNSFAQNTHLEPTLEKQPVLQAFSL